MTKPAINKVFYPSKRKKIEKENFQGYLFKDLNFMESGSPVSFFRCDFRGVKVERVKFYKNNFNRSDFFNSYITQSEFKDCYFGTDFTNTVFDQVTFSGNKLDTCAFFNCRFLNCSFENEKVTGTTNRQSKYSNCEFTNSTFEENSFDDLDFEHSSFTNINLAEMSAHNFTFDACKFNNVIVDPDYLGSYLIKNSDPSALKYKYRGRELSLTGNIQEDYKSLSIFFLQNNRFYEAFNSGLLYAFYTDKTRSISPFLDQVLQSLISTLQSIFLIEQLNRIIKTIMFYFNSQILPLKWSFHFVGELEQANIQFRDINEKLEYNNRLQLLKETIYTSLIEEQNLLAIDPHEMVYMELGIEEKDFKKFKKYLTEFSKAVTEEYQVYSEQNCLQIVGTRKGSLIVEIIGYSVAVYVLAIVAKSIMGKGLEIKMEYQIAQQTKAILFKRDRKELKNWNEKVVIARKIQKMPSEEIQSKSKHLISLLKSFNIFPNALLKSR